MASFRQRKMIEEINMISRGSPEDVLMMSWENRYQANCCAPADPPGVVIQTSETLRVDVNFVGGVYCKTPTKILSGRIYNWQ